MRPRRKDDAWRWEQLAVPHSVNSVDSVMKNLIVIEIPVHRMVMRGGDSVAISGARRRSAALADDAHLRHATWQRPGQLDFLVAQLYMNVLHISQKNERAEGDRGYRFNATPLAQDGIAHGLSRRSVHVVKFISAYLCDPRTIPGMIERAPALTNDDEGQRTQPIWRRRAPRQSDAIAKHLAIQSG